MKLEKIISTPLILLFILYHSSLWAQSARMIFWYPGEAGNSQMAAPILNLLFEYLENYNEKLSFSGAYYNDIASGKKSIQSKSADIMIVSHSAHTEYKKILNNASILLSTLPLPNASDSQYYWLIGSNKSIVSNQILSSEPLSKTYIRTHLFPELPDTILAKKTQMLFLTLKKSIESKKEIHAILTENEAYTLKHLEFNWIKSIQWLKKSHAVPSPKVILTNSKWPYRDLLIKALTQMKESSEGKEILSALRLAGFAKIK